MVLPIKQICGFTGRFCHRTIIRLFFLGMLAVTFILLKIIFVDGSNIGFQQYKITANEATGKVNHSGAKKIVVPSKNTCDARRSMSNAYMKKTKVGSTPIASIGSVARMKDTNDSAKMLIKAYEEFDIEVKKRRSTNEKYVYRKQLIKNYEIYSNGQIVPDLQCLNRLFSKVSQNPTELRLRYKKGGEYNWLEFRGGASPDVCSLPNVGPVCRNGQIGYMRWRICSSGTGEQLLSYIEECGKCDGLVIDVCGNPGGHLVEAIVLTGYWIPHASVVELYRDVQQLDKAQALATLKTKTGDGSDMPVVFITDAHTGSTAEVSVAIMKAWNVGKSVGQKTKGDGIAYIRLETDTPGSKIPRTIQALICIPGFGKNGLFHNRGVSADVAVSLGFALEDGSPNEAPMSFGDRCQMVAFRILRGGLSMEDR